MARRKKRYRGEGTVFLRKDGRWQASYKPAGSKRLYFYGRTQEEALEKLHKAQDEERRGTLATGPQMKLADYLTQWLESVERPILRVTSYSNYRNTVNKHIIPALGHIQLQRLTPQQVQAFYNKELAAGYSRKTIRGYHLVLHKALGNAVKWGLVGRNVCDLVSPPALREKEMQVLTVEQAQRLLQTARAHRLEVLLTVALVTGMRRGELLGLRWHDIDFQAMSLQVRRTIARVGSFGIVESEPKTAKGRRKIMLPAFVVDMLRQHRVHQQELREKAGDKWREAGFVFCNAYGDHMEPTNLHEEFKRLLRQAGLPDVRFHDLRHSAATILLGMGIHPKIVQEILGHSSISITLDTYSHVLPSMQREAMDKVEDIFKRPT